MDFDIPPHGQRLYVETNPMVAFSIFGSGWIRMNFFNAHTYDLDSNGCKVWPFAISDAPTLSRCIAPPIVISSAAQPVDELPALRSLGASMQVGDERFNSDEIRSLYDRGNYPLRKSCSD